MIPAQLERIRPGVYRHPSGLRIFRLKSQSGRWHLDLDIPIRYLDDPDGYLHHPRFEWWRSVKDTLGDHAGFGQPMEQLVHRVERALEELPLPPKVTLGNGGQDDA